MHHSLFSIVFVLDWVVVGIGEAKSGWRNLVGLVGMGVHPIVIMVVFNISLWVPMFLLDFWCLMFSFCTYILPYFALLLWNVSGTLDEPAPTLVIWYKPQNPFKLLLNVTNSYA
jgi:hypothetical protein